MFPLNNLVLEGKVFGGPIFLSEAENNGKKSCKLEIKVEEPGKSFDVSIIGYGSIADFMNNKVNDGRGIRVVGKLAHGDSELGLYILAEHVEVKPKKK